MISVVLDTNVLVASVLKPNGEYSRVLGFILSNLDKFQIAISSQVRDEYAEVLSRRFITLRGLSKVATGLLEIIDDVATEVVPKSLAHLAFPDVDDKPFVELAVYTNSIIITNNIQDFPFADLKVLRAGEFLKLFGR